MEAVNSLSPEWVDGINDASFRDAITLNPYFYSGSNLKPYIAKDISFKPIIDSTTIKNMFRINALILDSDTELNRIDLATTGSDTYNIGKAWDIVYVARLITSDIRDVASNTVFNVSLPVSEIIGNYDSRFTTNNLGGRLVCNIFKDNDKYIRKFNISGQTITLDEGITGLDNTYTFELINAYDVLPEGLEQTTGYPVRGYVIKHVKPSEDCYIKFPKYDIPNREVGASVVIYYRKVNEAQPIFTFQDSIDKYGLFAETISLDFPISQDQLNLITNELEKFKEPLITLELETYRPSYAQRGWSLPVNITNAIYNGNYSVVSKSIEYIHPEGQKENYPLIKQNVKLANYINNLESIIASFKRQAQVKANIAQNFQNKTIINMKYSITSNEGINNIPVALPATNLTGSTFDVNFTAVSSISYQIQVASDIGFTSIINQFDINGAFALGSTITQNFDFSLYPPIYNNYYYRVRATFGGGSTPSSWSNIINVEVSNGFPTSITGAWGTKTLTYDYIFNPQTSGDFTNYGSISGTIPYLDRRNSGDNYPTWINESGDFGLDFSNSPYGGLRVPSNNFSSNPSKITIIVLGRITQSSPSPFFVASNINNNSGINGLSLSTDTPMNIYLVARNGNSTDRYFSDNTTAIFTTSDCMFTFSVDLTNNTKDFVKNQSTISTTEDIDQINFLGDPSIDMVIGSNWQFGAWGGGDTKLIIKKIAFLNDKLTDAQIKKIHEIMGF